MTYFWLTWTCMYPNLLTEYSLILGAEKMNTVLCLCVQAEGKTCRNTWPIKMTSAGVSSCVTCMTSLKNCHMQYAVLMSIQWKSHMEHARIILKTGGIDLLLLLPLHQWLNNFLTTCAMKTDAFGEHGSWHLKSSASSQIQGRHFANCQCIASTLMLLAGWWYFIRFLHMAYQWILFLQRTHVIYITWLFLYNYNNIMFRAWCIVTRRAKWNLSKDSFPLSGNSGHQATYCNYKQEKRSQYLESCLASTALKGTSVPCRY